MNERAEKIVDVITDVIDDKDVQAGFPDANGNTNVTWCNRALNRMLTMLGGKADLILEPRGINWTNANAMVKNARVKAKRITDGREAQLKANDGELVAIVAPNSKGPGHVALVCPDEDEYSESRGVLIGQAGARCGIMRLRDGFAHLLPVVEFYHIPYNTEGYSA